MALCSENLGFGQSSNNFWPRLSAGAVVSYARKYFLYIENTREIITKLTSFCYIVYLKQLRTKGLMMHPQETGIKDWKFIASVINLLQCTQQVYACEQDILMTVIESCIDFMP